MNSPSKRHFLTDAAIYGVGGMMMQLASVILLPLYTRFLDPSDYGIIDIIERVGHIINVTLMTGGIRQASMTFYLQAEEERQRRKVAVTITTLWGLVYVLGSLLVVMLAPRLGPLLGMADRNLFIFGVMVVLLEVFTSTPLALMQARVESISYISWQAAMLIIRVGLAILFVAVLGLGIWGVYWALLIVFLGFGVSLTIREIRRGSRTLDRRMSLEIARFSLPFIPTGILGFVFFNSDRFFLVGTAGTAALGIYALGHKLAAAVGMISTGPLFRVWTAKMYAVFEQPDARHQVGRMLTRILTVHFAVGLALAVFHRELLAVLSSESYAGAGAVIAPLILANAFLGANTFFEGVYYVFRKTKYKPLTALIGTAAILAACALLIPRFSVIGAAYALLAGFAVMAMGTYIVAQRIFRVNYELMRLGLLAAVSIACYLPSQIIGLGWGPLLVRICLYCLWLAVVWGLGIVHHDDKRQALALTATAWQKIRRRNQPQPR